MRGTVGRNAVYNLVGSLLPLALSLITVPIYLHTIGADRYGVLAIAWLFLGYFGMFDLGLGRATSYRIAAQRDAPREDRAVTFWTAALINPGIGLIGGALLFAASQWFFSSVFKVDPSLRGEVLASVPYLALAVPIATLTGTLTGSLQGRERFFTTNLISVVSTALFQLFPLAVALIHGPDLPTLLLAAVSARLIGVLWLSIECYREIARGVRPRISRERFRDLMRYGGWISVSSILGPVLVLSDRFMIGGVLGATSVAHYTIPFQLAQRIAVFPSAITTALFPRLSSAGATADNHRLGDQAARIIAALLTPVLVVAVLLVEPFLKLWIGHDLGIEIAPVARFLIIAYWCNALALVSSVQLQGLGRPDAVTKILLVQIPPYLAALYFGMHFWGLLGCAVALIARCLLDLGLQRWSLSRRLPPAYVAVELVALGCAAAAASVFARMPGFGSILGAGALILSAIMAARLIDPVIRDRLIALVPPSLRLRRQADRG